MLSDEARSHLQFISPATLLIFDFHFVFHFQRMFSFKLHSSKSAIMVAYKTYTQIKVFFIDPNDILIVLINLKAGVTLAKNNYTLQ